MRKLWALVLAVAMTASLSVVAFAGGGGGRQTAIVASHSDDLYWGMLRDDGTSDDTFVASSSEEQENDTSTTEFTADTTLPLKRSVHVPAGASAGVTAWISFYTNTPEGAPSVPTPPQNITGVTSENGVFTVRKLSNVPVKDYDSSWEAFYELEPAQPCTEVGTVLEDNIVVTTKRGLFVNKPCTYKFPVTMTMTDTPYTAPSGGSASAEDEPDPPATENAANDTRTTAAIEQMITALADPDERMPSNAVKATTAAGDTLTVIPVKLSSGDALSIDTMNLLGDGSAGAGLQAKLGGMTVTIPGGFGHVTEKSRVYYPLVYDTDPAAAGAMKAAVRGENARSEAVKAGGDMRMPGTVTLSLKTRLSGPVNVYYYNDLTRRFTLLATATPRDGWITLPTRQMGNLLLTTGTV